MLTSFAAWVQSTLGTPLRFLLPFAAIAILWAMVATKVPVVRALLKEKGRAFAKGFLLALLSITALLAVENYRATDYYRYDSYLNAYEFFHYYLGSKYAHELGYTRLYSAALIADDETGLKWNHKTGTIRDLATMGYVPVAKVLKERDAVKNHFSPARWEDFKQDVRWFKSKLVLSRWNGVLRDKGYNGTPVWGMLVGGLFTNRISTQNETGMMFLALLDPLLLLLAFGAVMWAFGPRTALFMVVLLGTHYMMKWWHMKGALLRTDWAVCGILCACLLKKQRYGLAGGVLAWTILARVFPAVLLFGPGVKLLAQLLGLRYQEDRPRFHAWMDGKSINFRRGVYAGMGGAVVLAAVSVLHLVTGAVIPFLSGDHNLLLLLLPPSASVAEKMLRLIGMAVLIAVGAMLAFTAIKGLLNHTLDRRWLRFFLSFGLTTCVLMGGSMLYSGGADLWREYQKKIGDHNRGISEWRVGYKYIFMADWSTAKEPLLERPFNKWIPTLNVQRYNTYQREWWTDQFLVLGLALLAALGLRDHRAWLMGFVPLFYLAAPTYYYYIMLLIPLLFFAERPASARYAVGLTLMFLTAMSGYVFYDSWKQGYATYYWLSVQVMIMCWLMLGLGLWEGLEGLWVRRREENMADGEAA